MRKAVVLSQNIESPENDFTSIKIQSMSFYVIIKPKYHFFNDKSMFCKPRCRFLNGWSRAT